MKYKCIKQIKEGPTKIELNDVVIITNENENMFLLSDINFMKGLSIEKDKFSEHFINAN